MISEIRMGFSRGRWDLAGLGGHIIRWTCPSQKKISRLHRTSCNVGATVGEVTNLPEIAHIFHFYGLKVQN